MRTIALIALLTIGLAGMAGAAQPIHSVVPPPVAVCLRATGPITIDGDPGEAAWQEALPYSALTISGSDLLAPNQTVFRMLHDGEALYIGGRCFEENMPGLKTNITSRDGSVWQDDCIELFLDTSHDHESFYQLITNAIGTRFDARTGSNTWDGDWEAAGSIGPDSWSIELRVPFATLAVAPPAVGALWGMNLCRERLATGDRELHNWADVEGNFHRPWLFGHLYFAGPSFELTDEVARALYAAIEVPARVDLPTERTLVTADGVAERTGFRDLLAAQFEAAAELRALHDELSRAYAGTPDAPFREEFAQLDERYAALQTAATGADALSALRWAQHTVEVAGLTAALDELSWKVKIALLLRDA